MVWDDPDGDGNPTDAVKIRNRQGTIQQPTQRGVQFFQFDPPIEIEPGSSFFAGVYMVLSENWYPAAFDDSASNGGSWIAFDQDEIDLDDIGGAEFLSTLPGAGFPGQWLITATPIYEGGDHDCNVNGVPDACDIEDGTVEDADFDGIPDECEGGADCPADLDGDGVVGGGDLGIMFVQWGGSGPADLDGDGVVGGSDLGTLFVFWGDCP